MGVIAVVELRPLTIVFGGPGGGVHARAATWLANQVTTKFTDGVTKMERTPLVAVIVVIA